MKVKKTVKNFVYSYLDLPQKTPNIACIGGGTGMPTLLSGLKHYSDKVTAIVTMADEGGSTGRLRRLMGVPAVGDLRKCLAALSDEEVVLTKLLNYRFKGDPYSEADDALGGHSFGNLFLSALTDITGDFEKAVEEASKILNIRGKVLPSTNEDVHIWAETTSGEKIHGEEAIDLGKYNGDRTIKRLHLDIEDAPGYKKALEAIAQADLITAGPGDLYTSIMPNLLIKDIVEAIKQSSAKKVFIINVANKPFETPNYKASDYLQAIKNHTGDVLFDSCIVNTNEENEIPSEYKYHYVEIDEEAIEALGVELYKVDVINPRFPLHHDSSKLAAVLMNLVQSA